MERTERYTQAICTYITSGIRLQLLVNPYPPYTSPYVSYRMLAILQERGWLFEADSTSSSLSWRGWLRVSEPYSRSLVPGTRFGETRASWSNPLLVLEEGIWLWALESHCLEEGLTAPLIRRNTGLLEQSAPSTRWDKCTPRQGS